eukprot:48670-Eustigmatos_ZCMA.PRE.1
MSAKYTFGCQIFGVIHRPRSQRTARRMAPAEAQLGLLIHTLQCLRWCGGRGLYCQAARSREQLDGARPTAW